MAADLANVYSIMMMAHYNCGPIQNEHCEFSILYKVLYIRGIHLCIYYRQRYFLTFNVLRRFREARAIHKSSD